MPVLSRHCPPARILACLLAGFVTTAVVTLAFLVLVPEVWDDDDSGFVEIRPDNHYHKYFIEQWPAHEEVVYKWDPSPLSEMDLYWMTEARDVGSGDRYIGSPMPHWVRLPHWNLDELQESGLNIEMAAGWPWRAFWAASVDYLNPDPSPAYASSRDCYGGVAVMVPIMEGEYRGDLTPMLIPLTPIWSGLILDTLLYGAVWYFLLWIARRSLRLWRRRRGRCPFCGYRMTMLPGDRCPECGATSKAGGLLNTPECEGE